MKNSAYDLVVGDKIRLHDSDKIYEVHWINGYEVVVLMTVDTEGNSLHRHIAGVTWYIGNTGETQQARSWQDNVDMIGFEYIED